MASIAFFAYATAAGGATVLGASTVIGGGIMAAFIDQGLILPRLFPGPDNTGPKFDDTNLQSASEGAPINRCYGGASRMGGQLLWLGPLEKVSTIAATSGKGGGYQVNADEYKRDVAVAFCGNAVGAIDQLTADGKKLWTEDPNISITDDEITATIQAGYLELKQPALTTLEDDHLGSFYTGQIATVSGYPRKSTFAHTNPSGANKLWFKGSFPVHTGLNPQTITLDANGSFGLSGNVTLNDSFTIAHGGSVGTVRYWFRSTVSQSGGEIDVTITSEVTANFQGLLAAVTDNTEVTIEGGNNGDYEVLISDVNLTTAIPRMRLGTAHGQAVAAGNTITVSQTGIDSDPSKLESIEVYQGTDYQDPDPTMEAVLNAGNVPAYRGRAYVVIKGLVLTDFGNRVPNLTARCTVSADESYQDAIGTIIADTGMPSRYYDVSNLSGTLAPGYYAQGSLQASQTLQPYMVAGEIVAREEDGVLVFYERVDVPEVDVDASDLGAHVEGSDMLYPARVVDQDDFDTPNSVTVTFLDASKDYQSGSVTEKAPGVVSLVTAQARLPLGMSSDQARDIAKHALYNARTNRQRLTKSLPPSYLGVGENMRSNVTVFGEDWTILTQRVDFGADWVIEVEGVREDTGILEFAESTSAPITFALPSKTKSPPAVRLLVMDSAPLSDAHSGILGFYVAASSYQEDQWGACVLYWSSDSGATYKKLATISERATMGAVQGVLADGPIGIWDRVNTLTVELDSGELESVTEGECLKGANRLWVSSGARGEIVGFTTATLVGERTYELSGLLRGLRDTRDYTAEHADGDTVVLLGEGVHFIETNAASVGVQRMFKLVPNGGAVATASELTTRLQGYTMRPFAPAHVVGTRDGSENLTVTAVKRSRRLVALFSPIGSPGADPSASMTYELDVMSGSTVLRTITEDALSFGYTAAEQITDGLTPGDPVTVRVYAVSETVGRGNYTEAIV